MALSEDGNPAANRGRLGARPGSADSAAPRPAPGLHRIGLGEARDGLLRVPDAATDHALPLVVMLHGAGGHAAGALRLIEAGRGWRAGPCAGKPRPDLGRAPGRLRAGRGLSRRGPARGVRTASRGPAPGGARRLLRRGVLRVVAGAREWRPVHARPRLLAGFCRAARCRRPSAALSFRTASPMPCCRSRRAVANWCHGCAARATRCATANSPAAIPFPPRSLRRPWRWWPKADAAAAASTARSVHTPKGKVSAPSAAGLPRPRG